MKNKKKIFLLISLLIIFLIFLLPKIITPKKVLDIGTQVDENTFKFTEEIKNQKTIEKYEEWFNEIEFTEEENLQTQDQYAEIILQIKHKEGIFTHPISIWITENQIIAVNAIGEDNSISELSDTQIKDLRSIINQK